MIHILKFEYNPADQKLSTYNESSYNCYFTYPRCSQCLLVILKHLYFLLSLTHGFLLAQHSHNYTPFSPLYGETSTIR